MTDNMKKFLEAASSDEAMKDELQAVADSTAKNAETAVMEFAAKHGFTLTEEDFESSKMEELTEDELEAVGGGSCACFVGGGGGGDGLLCVCPLVGVGTIELPDSTKQVVCGCGIIGAHE